MGEDYRCIISLKEKDASDVLHGGRGTGRGDGDGPAPALRDLTGDFLFSDLVCYVTR